MSANHPLCFILPVWGEQFVSYFLELSLPSQLATGNIGSLVGSNHHYCIYTVAIDKQRIESSSVYKTLCEHINVHLNVIDENESERHERASMCFRAGINFAKQFNAAIVVLVPDAIFSRNSFAYMQQQLEAGYKIIMAACPTFEREKGSAFLQNYKPSSEILNASGRELIETVKHAMHPNTKEQFYESESGNLMPGCMYWYVGNEGMLAHAFHLHPLLVLPTNWDYEFAGTIDGDYIHGACKTDDKTLIVQDSDDLCMIEIADATWRIDATHKKNDPNSIIDWAIIHANPQHMQCVFTTIKLRSLDYTGHETNWLLVAQKSRAVLQHVQQHFFGTKLSLLKFYKFRYAYLRRFMFNLRLAAQQPNFNNIPLSYRTLLGLHRAYLQVATRFSAWQTRQVARLFSKDRTHAASIFNIYYWLFKNLPAAVVERIVTDSTNIYIANPQQVQLLNIWFKTAQFKESDATKNQHYTDYKLELNLAVVSYITFVMPTLVKWSLRGNSPMLIQMLLAPLTLPLKAISIATFNTVCSALSVLKFRTRYVNLQMSLLQSSTSEG